MEVQVWLELDAFFRGLAVKSGGAVPAPAQVLSLLPPPPAGAGWPAEFALLLLVRDLRKTAAAKRSMDMFNPMDDSEPYVPVGDPEYYPARRRIQRLSYVVWSLIRPRDGTGGLQGVLEAASTSDRLRMALVRLRALREQTRS